MYIYLFFQHRGPRSNNATVAMSNQVLRSWLLKPLKQPGLLGEMADFRTEPEKCISEVFNIL